MTPALYADILRQVVQAAGDSPRMELALGIGEAESIVLAVVDALRHVPRGALLLAPSPAERSRIERGKQLDRWGPLWDLAHDLYTLGPRRVTDLREIRYRPPTWRRGAAREVWALVWDSVRSESLGWQRVPCEPQVAPDVRAAMQASERGHP